MSLLTFIIYYMDMQFQHIDKCTISINEFHGIALKLCYVCYMFYSQIFIENNIDLLMKIVLLLLGHTINLTSTKGQKVI